MPDDRKTTTNKKIKVKFNNKIVLNEDMRVLRGIWEETSYQLEKHQVNPDCATEEKKVIFDRKGYNFNLTFTPKVTLTGIMAKAKKPSVAIIREEGSNSDREMSSAFYQAGFDVWDVAMTDFLEGRVNPDNFRGMAFVGGFSYADVLDSAKRLGRRNKVQSKIYEQFQKFYNRPDTFSLSVCNGCQLAALLVWSRGRG